MAKVFKLDLVATDGRLIPATAHVRTVPVPGSVWRNYAVRFEWPGGESVGSGDDIFDALRKARGPLDAAGLSPRCYGACRNFVMSGMASQMGGGGAGYLVTLGRRAETKLVMTLEAGPDMDIVSVAEQDAFRAAWLASLDRTPN